MTEKAHRMPKRTWLGLHASVRDLVLLVVGILIAFGLDASWENLKEGRDDNAQLVALAAEFEEIIRVLEDDSVSLSVHMDATEALVGLFGSSPLPEAEEIIATTRASIGSRTLQIPNGVLSQFFAEGTISRLKDTELRSRLASWLALVDDTAEQLEWLRTHRDEELVPELNEYIPLRTLQGGLELGSSPFIVRTVDLLESRTLEGMLVYRIQIGRTGLREFSELLRAARRIRALLGTVTD